MRECINQYYLINTINSTLVIILPCLFMHARLQDYDSGILLIVKMRNDKENSDASIESSGLVLIAIFIHYSS